MTSIDWKLLDDYEFVYLTQDVLRKMGFVDLLLQGSGPDGGLDLIATELVSFAVQGQQPFKWGIQCKFSEAGIDRSVNDHEIRDVTGILASDRYGTHDLRGYMIVTNRKIAQNVIERLRGINRTSPFRTAFIDGYQLQQRLNHHPDIVEKYFGEIKSVVGSLGPPLIEGRIQNSQYLVEVEIRSPTGIRSVTLPAVLDTAAEISVIPKAFVDQLDKQAYTTLTVGYSDGRREVRNAVFAEIRFKDGEWIREKMLIFDTDIAMVGQNVLKHFTVLIDAPKGLVRVWPELA